MPFAQNMLSADPVFHVAVGVSLSTLFCLYLEAPCITLTPGFFALRQHDPDRTEELLMMPTPQ
jgi:hypothetical protein